MNMMLFIISASSPLALMCQNNVVTPQTCRQVSNIRRILAGNKIVDHSDVVGASSVGTAHTTSSFST